MKQGELLRAAGAFTLAALLSAGSGAETHRLDDSLSYTVPPNAQMQWRQLPRGGGDPAAMEAWVRVNVRIDTRQWAGRAGRVYMALARDETSTIEAVWTTQGRLLEGRVLSGERSLVFSGTLPGPTLEDQLVVRLRSGADWQSKRRRLDFHFELDVP